MKTVPPISPRTGRRALAGLGALLIAVALLAGPPGPETPVDPSSRSAVPSTPSPTGPSAVPQPVMGVVEPVDAPAGDCHPSYTGACLDPAAADYDCEGGGGNGPYYTGPVDVVGPDVFRLDRDGDGVGCE